MGYQLEEAWREVLGIQRPGSHPVIPGSTEEA
jgi:hypothetical protein